MVALLSQHPVAAQVSDPHASQDGCGVLVDGAVTCSPSQDLSQGTRYDADGDITINLEDGLALTPMQGFAGVIAVSNVLTGGSVAIDGSGATITTTDAIGTVVEADGDITVSLGSVSATAATPGETAGGIWTATTAGSTRIDVGSIETIGELARAIVVEGYGSGSVDVNAGSVSTNGTLADGITVISGGTSTVNLGSFTGRGDGIYGVFVQSGVETEAGYAYGPGFINVGTIDLVGNQGAGIVYTGAGDAYIGAGTVKAIGDGNFGVYYRGEGSTFITVDTLNLEGLNSTGLYAEAFGSVYIDVEDAVFKGEATGVIVGNSYLGDVSINVGSLTAEGGSGVIGVADGNVLIKAGTVNAAGFLGLGVGAGSTRGSVSIDVSAIGVEGFGARAISAEAFGGDLTIRAGTVNAIGENAQGIQASARTSLIQVDGALKIEGDGGVGILSSTTRGDNVVIVNGPLSTTGKSTHGLRITGRSGEAKIRTATTVSTTGDRAYGIWGTGEDGQVVVEAASVTTSGAKADGIHARTRYTEFFLGDPGLEPVPFTGDISIRASQVAVTGAGANGISAKGLGNADILAGDVSALAGTAIEADMIGEVALDLRGTITSGGASAINATATNVDVRVGAAARIYGAVDGLVINAAGPRCKQRPPKDGSPNPCVNPGADEFFAVFPPEEGPVAPVDAGPLASIALPDPISFGGAARIQNRGTIEAVGGYAVRAEKGTVALENDGTIVGAIKFGAGDDVFANHGLFRMTKDSDFGAGFDVLRNSGTLSLAASQVRLAGLDRLENSGSIDLRNGAAGDVLTISGGYVGSASATLHLDVDGVRSRADRLVVEGDASGSTVVNLLTSPSTATLTDPKGIVVIDVKGKADKDTFILADSARDIGFVRYSLTRDAATGSYAVIGRAGRGAYRQLGALQASNEMWATSSDLWRARSLAIRDSQGDDPAGLRLWGTLQGGRSTRDWSAGTGGESFDLDYRMTRQGGQLGFDLAGSNTDSNMLRIGVTAGYSTATLNYDPGERIKLSTANAGLYANYVSDRVFANLLVKYDRHEFEFEAAALTSQVGLDGSTLGAEGEAGVRLGGPDLFIEPSVGLAWTHTQIDSLVTASQQIDFDNSNLLKGRAGVRFGGTTNFSQKDALTVYAGLNAVQLFGKDYALKLTSGGSQRITAARLGTYGEGRIGLGYRTSGGFELFAEGQGEIGNGYDGVTGRAGFRVAL